MLYSFTHYLGHHEYRYTCNASRRWIDGLTVDYASAHPGCVIVRTGNRISVHSANGAPIVTIESVE